MKKWIVITLISFCVVACSQGPIIDFVKPMIGTDGTGHTFPGACVPFGMVQLSPDGATMGWEHCSGYHYKDSTIQGFSHTHLSGTGCGDLGDVMLMPYNSPADKSTCLVKNYSMGFKHENEKASVGFYEVTLNDGIDVQLTATERCGFHQYTFPNSSEHCVMIDLLHGIQDFTTQCNLHQLDSVSISGYRFSEGWAHSQKIFFAAKFSQPITGFNGEDADSSLLGRLQHGAATQRVCLCFNGKEKVLLVKVGISTVSEDAAMKNLATEITDWNFNRIKSEAENKWETQLSKIKVGGGSLKTKECFYTALYHCMIHPSMMDDVDGKYRGMDDSIHAVAAGHHQYQVFSLWDTYRALHPLLSIINPQVDEDCVQSMLNKFDESGLLPVWELMSNETNCMIGYHSMPVITDAYMKGITGFNAQHALDAMIVSSNNSEEEDLQLFIHHQYIPGDKLNESVSKTLEYSYDDWCIATLAHALHNDSIANIYYQRSNHFQNVWDDSSQFFRAKKSGQWIAPFNPYEVNGYYTEANAWQYRFAVQHNIPWLMERMGGPEKFAAALDSLFTTHSQLEGRNQPDISGMMGQYAQGNEPSHHDAYLYNYAGMPWKTDEKIHYITTNFFTNTPDGLIGNDDCGQMSAWYVFSCMGFYPVCPGSNEYAIGTPAFDNIEIDCGGLNTFKISAQGLSEENFIVDDASIDDQKLTSAFFRHEDLLNKKMLLLSMSNTHTRTWDVKKQTAPSLFVATPTFNYASKAFDDSLVISIHSNSNATLFFYLNDAAPGTFKHIPLVVKYDKPIVIKNSLNLTAWVVDSTMKNAGGSVALSGFEEASFTKIPYHRSITYEIPYNSLYTAGGINGLLDFENGATESWGNWQGFEGTDFCAVVSLKGLRTIHHVGSNWLNARGSWIFNPIKVTYEISTDSVHWKTIGDFANVVEQNDNNGIEVSPQAESYSGWQAAYVRVRATSIKHCPAWHPGAGNKCWLFVDEISIE